MKLSPSEPESPQYIDEQEDNRAETESLVTALSLRSYYASSDDGLPAYTDEAATPLTPGTTEYSGSQQTGALYNDISSSIPGAQNTGRYSLAQHVPHPIWSSKSRVAGPRPPSGTTDAAFTADPERLRDLLINQASLAPRPFVQFEGVHNEKREDNGKTETRVVTDFTVLVDCSELFQRQNSILNDNDMPWHELHTVPDHVKAHRGGIFARQAKAVGTWNSIGDLEGSAAAAALAGNDTTIYDATALRGWCHIYCSKANRSLFPYTLTLRRRVSDWDIAFLSRSLTEMIRQTNYRGHVHVTFPLEDTTFTVYSPHWMNRARNNTYIWWSIVLLQLWIITWPVLWLCTGRFEVLHSVWPYKKRNPTNEAQPIYASYSEQRWLDTWGLAVVDAALARRQQMVTAADVERVMLLQEASARARQGRPVGTGNSIGGAAVAVFHGLADARNQMDLAQGLGADDDAGWWITTRHRLTKKVMLK